MKFLSDLVPHEPAEYLKVLIIKCPLPLTLLATPTLSSTLMRFSGRPFWFCAENTSNVPRPHHRVHSVFICPHRRKTLEYADKLRGNITTVIPTCDKYVPAIFVIWVM